jgi:hypothetical protein
MIVVNDAGCLISKKPEAVIRVTRHGVKRFKERLGLSKKGGLVQAQIAYEYGLKQTEANGKVREYMDRLFLKSKKTIQLRIFWGFIYIFRDFRLITVMELRKSMQENLKLDLRG